MATDYREWEPRTTVELGTAGSGLLRALTLTLSDDGTHAVAVRWQGPDVALRIASAQGPRARLTVERKGSRLRIVETG